jgi:hypothetical protein
MSFELTGDTDIIYSLTAGSQVTDQQLRRCAVNYSTSFGVWSAHAAQKLGAYAIKGKPKPCYVFIKGGS